MSFKAESIPYCWGYIGPVKRIDLELSFFVSKGLQFRFLDCEYFCDRVLRIDPISQIWIFIKVFLLDFSIHYCLAYFPVQFLQLVRNRRLYWLNDTDTKLLSIIGHVLLGEYLELYRHMNLFPILKDSQFILNVFRILDVLQLKIIAVPELGFAIAHAHLNPYA